MNLVKLIDDRLIKMREERDKEYAGKERNGHYPSSASIKLNDTEIIGSCILAEYRKWKKIPETNPYDVDTLQKFTWGDMFHDWITEMLEKECLEGNTITSISTEKANSYIMPVSGLEMPIRGRIDNVINKNVALEIKSSFGKFFFSKEGLMNKGPRSSNLMQTLCYLKARPDLEYAILLFLARDIGFKVQYKVYRYGDSIKTFHYDKGQTIEQTYPEISWQKIIDRWAELERNLILNEEPKPDFRFRSKYPCTYCTYYDMCYPEHKKAKTPAKYDIGQNEG